MQCPFCQTENREDRETCYVCSKDISTIRMLVNKARQHYNDALEHAERDRTTEAIDELHSALALDATLVNAHVVLGTLHARQGEFAQARECWKRALELNPEMARAHDYLERVESVQAALPTIKTYRRVAFLLLTVAVALAAFSIYKLRPAPGLKPLIAANEMFEAGRYRDAEKELEQAKILAEPHGAIKVAAESFSHTLALDLQQRLRLIQDLKFRQLYPQALFAMAELEATQPDETTSAALSVIREDIGYYYRNMLSQLFAAYDKGDLDIDTLQIEVGRFIDLYPPSSERDEIIDYLQHAESIEVQSAMEELRRRFSMNNNVQSAVESLREITPRFENYSTFQTARSNFVEDILSSLINQYTGYLDQDDFVRALELLNSMEAVSTEFRQMMAVDISGAVELAWTLLKDGIRQYHFKQIEDYLKSEQLDAAEEALWQELLEDNHTKAELGVLRTHWRQLNARNPLKKLIASPSTDRNYFKLRISDPEASETLQLYADMKDRDLDHPDRIYLTGLAAASAIKLGIDDQATSLATRLKSLDKSSTITTTVDKLLRQNIVPAEDNDTDSNTSNTKVQSANDDNTTEE